MTTAGEWTDRSRSSYATARPTVYASNLENNSQPNVQTTLFVGKRTRNLANLQGRKKYECNICGAMFGTHGGRYYHMASHTGKFKYTCDLCDKGFMKTDAYRKHIIVHRRQIQGK